MPFEMISAAINPSMGCVEMHFGDGIVERARLSVLQRKLSAGDARRLKTEAAYLVAKAVRQAKIRAGLTGKLVDGDVNDTAHSAVNMLIEHSGGGRGI